MNQCRATCRGDKILHPLLLHVGRFISAVAWSCGCAGLPLAKGLAGGGRRCDFGVAHGKVPFTLEKLKLRL